MTDGERIAALDRIGTGAGLDVMLKLIEMTKLALGRAGVSVKLETLIDRPDEKLYGFHFGGEWLRFGWRWREPDGLVRGRRP